MTRLNPPASGARRRPDFQPIDDPALRLDALYPVHGHTVNRLREAGFSIEEHARLDNGERAWRIRRTDDAVSWVVITWAARALAFRVPTAVLNCVNPPRVLDAADGIGIPPEHIPAVRREWLLFTGDFPGAASALLQYKKDHRGRTERHASSRLAAAPRPRHAAVTPGGKQRANMLRGKTSGRYRGDPGTAERPTSGEAR